MRKLTTTELGRLEVEQFKRDTKAPIVIILDNIRSLHNVGSIFRTSDAFKIQAIYLCGITGTPPNKEIHKTALGATDSVEWKYFQTTNEAINVLKTQGYKLLAIEQTEKSIMLNNYNYMGEKLAIVFGNEVNGVEQEVINQCDGCLEIPQFGTKHSFNVSVTAGIVCWHLFVSAKDM